MNDLWQPIQFDREMLLKYDRPGPRYTSYPTAPHFEDGFGHAEYSRLLERSAESGRPLSLYVHIPFCAHRCFFCGCNVTISRDRQWGRRYLPMLAREMEMAAKLLQADRREVVQIHWGGGTPTFLPPEDLAELMRIIRHNFRLASTCEIGVEVDPRECSPAHLDALAAGGVNRLSMGLQELDPRVQEAVNRIQTREQTWAVLDGARQRGIESVNVDLIYGLPHQTPERFAATLEDVLRMAPDRLALFNFAYLPASFPHQRVLDPMALPSPDTKLRMLEEAIATLTAAGLVFIGMDHFARPGDPLAQALRDRTLTRSFQGYTTCGHADLIGFGVSSIGEVGGGYAQNLKTVGEYGAAIQDDRFAACRGLVLSEEDFLRRDLILRLMCQFRLDKRDVERRYGIEGFDRRFAAELEQLSPMAEDGLVEIDRDRIEVTPLGRLLVRNVAMSFDAYLGRSTVHYSRTV
ncbi:MAG TPA: oxygen-independent coproporphyrinogen III oxidase [Thermoanaerobaculia bacterium]|jgi:oxygen-independent coproporphyrinogen-3 oxidase|nr:oxygen-independent coproporphyrinogen III oxidase [Thermoanaerobaculia bacterium]